MEFNENMKILIFVVVQLSEKSSNIIHPHLDIIAKIDKRTKVRVALSWLVLKIKGAATPRITGLTSKLIEGKVEWICLCWVLELNLR